jgi:hypothetical protein
MSDFIKNNISSGRDFEKVYKVVKEANVLDRTEPLYHLVTTFCVRDIYKYKNIVMNKDKPMDEVLKASAQMMDDCIKAIKEIIKLIKKEWNYL